MLRLIAFILKHFTTHTHHLADYMLRYWIFFPRTKTWPQIRLHNILRSDSDRHLHDHPWWYASIILIGSYIEVSIERHADYDIEIMKQYGPGSILFRRATHSHRLILSPGTSVWTLFICGKKTREWGFWTENGWMNWREYLVLTGQSSLIEDEDIANG